MKFFKEKLSFSNPFSQIKKHITYDYNIFQKLNVHMQNGQYIPPASKLIPQASSARIYANIPLSKRQQLIELVLENDIPITMAARQTNINYSTAKTILRIYKKQGHIFCRKNQHFEKTQFRKKISQNMPRAKEQKFNNQEINVSEVSQEVKQDLSKKNERVLKSSQEQNIEDRAIMQIPSTSFDPLPMEFPYFSYPYFILWNYPPLYPSMND